MPLTTAQIVRNRLADMPRFGDEVVIGDGTASAFQLRQGAPHSTLLSGTPSAFVQTTGVWGNTAATFDNDLGLVTFSGVISAQSAVKVTYQWAVFSNDMLDYFTGFGGIAEATLAGVNHLLVDYAKRASWGSPDGTTHNDTQALNSLMSMRSALVSEIRGAELGPVGYEAAWSETQSEFGD